MTEQPTPEHAAPEQRSSVEIARNAKGDAQPRVKVYAGEDEAEMARLRDLAVRTYLAVCADLSPGATAARREDF